MDAQEARAMLARWEARLTELDAERVWLTQMVEATRVFLGGTSAVGATGDTSRRRRVRRGRNKDTAIAIMQEHPGRRFHARELVELMAQRGVVVTSSNPPNNVASTLRRLAEQEGTVAFHGAGEFSWIGDTSAQQDGDDAPTPDQGAAADETFLAAVSASSNGAH